MSKQTRELPTLLASLAITLLIVAGLLWWLGAGLGINLNRLRAPQRASPAPAAATFRDVGGVARGLFNYGGSTTWAPIRQQVDAQLQVAQPQFRLRYVDPVSGTPGSSTGIRMLLDGQLDFSQSSRPLKDDEYAKAQVRGFTLAQYPVGLDGIAVAVNPSLPVSGLSLDQLQQIYSGQITNWQQVGGPNLAITPLSRRPADAGTVEFFLESVLRQQPFSARVQYVYSTTDALRQLSSTPGGIYYASAPEVVPQCTVKPLPIGRTANQWVAPYREPRVPTERCPQQRNQLNAEAFQQGSYPITRQLFVIVKQNQGLEQQAGEAYTKLLLTDQGQQSIEQAGFVRIR